MDQTRVGTVWGWFRAMFGALTLGVGLPVLLVNLSYGFNSLYKGNANGMDVGLEARVGEALTLYIVGMILCSPGVAVLGSFVYAGMLSDARAGLIWRPVVVNGIVLSVLLSFLNLPGWLCMELLRGDSPGMRMIKVVALFAVAGTAAGAWIARAAWTVVHPEDGMVPRFSLKTLLAAVLAWSVLMGLFAPK